VASNDTSMSLETNNTSPKKPSGKAALLCFSNSPFLALI